MTDLLFKELFITNFRPFVGEHQFDLSAPGFFYVTGTNRLEPSLGANGLGKSTLFDAFLWVLFGVTSADNRPAGSVVPWKKYHAEGSTKVSVHFLRDDQEHLIERGRKPNKLELDGVIVEQDAINRVLGLDEDTTRRAVVLGQFGDLFLDMSSEQQSRMFTSALNLDLYLRAAQAAASKARVAEDSYNTEFTALSSLQGQLQTTTTALETAEKLEKGFATTRAVEIANEDGVLKEARSQLKVLVAPAVPTGLDVSDKGISAIEEAIASIRDDLREMDLTMARAEAQLTSAGLLETAAKKEVARIQQALKGKKLCPECGQQVSTAHLTAKLKEREKDLRAATLSASEWADRVAAAKPRREDAAERLCLREGALRDVRAARDTYHRAIQDYNQEKVALEGAVAATTELVARLRAQKNPHTATVRAHREQAKVLAGSITKAEATLKKLAEQAERLRFWVGGFKEIRLGLIESVLLELDLAANSHAEGLGLHGWAIKFATTRENLSGSVSTKFSATLTPPGESEPIPFQSYSGGERQRWNLAVAFGLAEVLLSRAGVQTNLLVLDEPTRHLSAEGVDDLIEHLGELTRSTGKSVFLVEHHALDKGAFDKVIFIEKSKEGAKIVDGSIILGKLDASPRPTAKKRLRPPAQEGARA